MGKFTAIQLAAVMAAMAVTSVASAETTSFQGICPAGNESVMVEVRAVPNLKQRCYEIVYEKQRGHICVWADGTPDGPYGYTRNFEPEQVTAQGWKGSGNVGCKANDCFNSLCRWLVQDHRREQDRLKFNLDAATKKLDEFFNSQVPRQAPEDAQE